MFFNEREITGMDPNLIAKEGIARTFQLLRIFPSMSVLDNLIVAQVVNEKSSVLRRVS